MIETLVLPPKRLVKKRMVRKSITRPSPKKKAVVKRIKPKKRSITKLKKELDRVFSIFIRNRDTNADGMVPCYTCPNKNEMKKMQNGHFVPRQYMATRYDEVNCHAQCYACNMLYNGQPSAYAARLKKDYGTDIVELLESKRTILVKDFPYEYWIEVYREKIAS